MNSRALLFALVVALVELGALAGTLTGHVRDPNWFARRFDTDPFGVGQYEYGVNANGTNISAAGGADDTDVFGAFSMTGLSGGSYTVASWDVWWRSAYAFNVTVPATGTSANADVRLKATMWGYPTFWDSTGYHEFGQTFVASGPISMIYLRAPAFTGAPQYTLTIREGGPNGTRVGAIRTFNTGDQRLVYAYGEMPTVAGQMYYLRIRTPSPAQNGVIAQMDPRPDYSDPMPGGCLWLGNGTTLTPYPDQDLGIVIMSDDDGLITNMFHRQGGGSFDGTSIGQTFVARGVNLISAAFWLADPTFPTYVVRVLRDGPSGTQVGTTKRGRVARSGDPEMIVVWAPGECPLTPGSTYYLEVTRDGGGVFNVALLNTSNPYTNGSAFTNGVAAPAWDMAGTIMEEQSAGAARQPVVQITAGPSVAENDRGSNWMIVRWTTSAGSDTRIEYAAEHPPYTETNHSAQLTNTQNHFIAISNLQANTMYHYRVSSARPNWRSAVSRDVVACTRPATSNLLANPGFEAGGGPGNSIPGWHEGPGVDIRATNSMWFFSVQPAQGSWWLQGSVNGSSSDSYISQRVSGLKPGIDCTFSASVMTLHRENDTYKYDVWQDQGRLIYMRLGIDPTGGTNVNAGTVQWTPRMYSHRHYTQLAKTVKPTGSNVTVFVSMKGQGGQWHVYVVDGCALTQQEIPTRFVDPYVTPEGVFGATIAGRANRSNLIEAASILGNWTVVTNVYNANGMADFETRVSGSRRFFRARVAP